MENYGHKEEIQNTRRGCLGGSDANMLSQIASLGYVPRSAFKRVAVMNGLIENPNITTRVMQYGDYIENAIYESLSDGNPNFISNPMWVSGKYSKENCKLICHADFVLYDEEKKILKVYECKATRYTVEQTRDNYKNQLFIEWTIANEIVKARGEGWKVQMYLCHYDTNGVNINEEFTFDPSRITVRLLRIKGVEFDINLAMTLVSEFATTFDYYTEDEEVDSQYLPENVKTEFDTVTGILAEIKEREAKVDEFKNKLCTFMQEKGLKSIKNENWNITLVGATENVSFDGKRFIAEYTKSHPRKAAKLKKDYEKRVAKGAYVLIKLNNKKNND